MNENLPVILSQLHQEFARILGDRLEGLYLYGSQARGDARPDSDIDVLAVIRGPVETMQLLEETAPASCGLSLEHNIVISSAFISKERFEQENSPFTINIRRDAVAI
jgi:predicted nucleotidyltransferase